MKKNINPEKLFNKIRQNLIFNKEEKIKLSSEETEYLCAIILLELDKGKRLNTLSKMDEEYIESLRKDVKERILPFKKDLYNKPISDANIDKKV